MLFNQNNSLLPYIWLSANHWGHSRAIAIFHIYNNGNCRGKKEPFAYVFQLYLVFTEVCCPSLYPHSRIQKERFQKLLRCVWFCNKYSRKSHSEQNIIIWLIINLCLWYEFLHGYLLKIKLKQNIFRKIPVRIFGEGDKFSYGGLKSHTHEVKWPYFQWQTLAKCCEAMLLF